LVLVRVAGESTPACVISCKGTNPQANRQNN